MNNFRAKLKNFSLIRAASSLKITVVCLGLLFVLTFWGTVAQVQTGLYLAQERYFHSFFFPVFKIIPFPGGQAVLWVLFLNLVAAAIAHFRYGWQNIGIIIIHFGLLTFFVAAFVTFHSVEESQLTLMEGAASNVASSYQDWELSVWTGDENEKDIVAYDTKNLKAGDVLDFPEYGFSLTVRLYHPNAQAYTSEDDFHENVTVNRAGIKILKPVTLDKDPGKNMPGGIFALNDAAGGAGEINVLLFGGEGQPTVLTRGDTAYSFMLRRKRFVLPFMVELTDFLMEMHPGTDVARSYQSRVDINSNNVQREVTISMNNPLRYKDFTFYQASYAIDGMGRELSTLAVVRNAGQVLPYIASFLTVFGLITHFLMMGFTSRKKTQVSKTP